MVNLDWINNQACSLSQNNDVITSLFYIEQLSFEMIRKIIFTDYFLNSYTKSPYNSGSERPCKRKVFNPTL